MKKFIFILLFLAGMFCAKAQKKTIDYVDTDVGELSDTRAAIFTKYATGKSKGLPMSKEDEDLLLKINKAVTDNPKPNVKIQMKGVPIEYSYENIKLMYQQISMQYFDQRKVFIKFKRALKSFSAQDTTVFDQLERDTNFGRQRFKLIAQDKEEQ